MLPILLPPRERTWKCWRIAFYQQYFDIDTRDIAHRAVYSTGCLSARVMVEKDLRAGHAP